MDLFSTMDTTSIELILRAAVQVLLLVMSAFFSGSETALFSLTRLDLQKYRTTRHPSSEGLHALLDEPRRLIISILCGNELVNIASAANMAAILLILVGAEDAGWVNMVVMVPMLLLFGEVTPKTIAVTFPDKFATSLSVPILPYWIKLIRPLREIVKVIADRVTTFFVGKATGKSNILDSDEFRTLVEEGEACGALDATERVLIDNMLSASATEVVSIMTPRTRLNYASANAPVSEMVAKIRETGFSRLPIVDDQRLDHIIGFLHSATLVATVQSGTDLDTINVREMLKPALAVPETKIIDEMFEFFTKNNIRTALVVREDGSISGIVTINDVLQFIFGGLTDEMVLLEKYKSVGDSSRFMLPGDMRLMDFCTLTNISIDDPRMTTLGGYVLRQFGHLPKVDSTVTANGITFRVVAMEVYRIQMLEVWIDGGEEADEAVASGKYIAENTATPEIDSTPAEEATPSADADDTAPSADADEATPSADAEQATQSADADDTAPSAENVKQGAEA